MDMHVRTGWRRIATHTPPDSRAHSRPRRGLADIAFSPNSLPFPDIGTILSIRKGGEKNERGEVVNPDEAKLLQLLRDGWKSGGKKELPPERWAPARSLARSRHLPFPSPLPGLGYCSR